MADFPNASPIINKQEQQWSHFIIIHCPPSYADKWNPWKFNISTQPFTAVTLFHRMQWVGDRPPRFLILRRRYCQDWCNRITEVVAHALEIYIDASCLRFRDPKGLFGYLNLWGGGEEEGEQVFDRDPRYFRDRICLINRGEMGVFSRAHDNGMIRIWLKSRFLNNSMRLWVSMVGLLLSN